MAIPSLAVANGRFPRAERVIENPNDPNELWLGATYGLLVTRDRGKSWRHVCEAGFALDGQYLGDPLISFASNGILAVGVQSALNLSSDDGCQWSPVLGASQKYVLDYTVAPSSPSTLVAVVADSGDGGQTIGLEESTDNGVTWNRVGSPLPVLAVFTVDVAPDDLAHIYATGLQNGAGQFLTSSDNGTTWTVYPIPGTSSQQPPYIAGVHPSDRKQIFVRTDGWTQGANAMEVANDALFYTNDEGKTWNEVFRNQAKLFGFALSPDGSTVLIGFGDPKGFQQAVLGPIGIFKSASNAFAFEQIFHGQVDCLTWTRTGVYVCASQQDEGFELAFSPTSDFATDGSCLTAILRLNEVQGPLQCAPNTASARCNGNWDTACATLGACADAGTSPSAASCVPLATPGGDGAAGETGEGGAATRDASTSADSGSVGSPYGGSTSTGGTGCGCRTAQSRSSPEGPLLMLACLGSTLRMRRGRRSNPKTTARWNVRGVGR